MKKTVYRLANLGERGVTEQEADAILASIARSMSAAATNRLKSAIYTQCGIDLEATDWWKYQREAFEDYILTPVILDESFDEKQGLMHRMLQYVRNSSKRYIITAVE